MYKGRLAGRLYFGLTGTTLESRRLAMLIKPKSFFRGCKDLSRLKLVPVVCRQSLDSGLALEAACTAEAWVGSMAPEVRGGPWCRGRLTARDKEEMRLVAEALLGQRTQMDREAAVRRVAGQCSRQGSLQRHLRCECFKCGEHFGRCSCIGLRRTDAHLDMPPPKSRSGKSPTGSRKRKDGRSKPGWTRGKELQYKWGADVEANRARDKRNWNQQNPDRGSGVRKRPAGNT